MSGLRVSERARRRCALFVSGFRRAAGPLLCVLLLPVGVSAAECTPDHIDERAAVEYVHDGDSIALADGRKLRLIGINAPELPYDGAPGQPFGGASRDALRDLLAGRPEIGLRFDRERHDRYDRLLAHVYTEDGVSVQAWMLERGYAAAIVVPPNLWNSRCYRMAERRGRDRGIGLWKLPYYRPLPARDVDAGTRGFRFVKGRVRRVGESRRSIWVNLEGHVALRIARTDLHHFQPGLPARLDGRIVVARGWLVPRQGGAVMQVRHPFALRVTDPPEAAPRRP